MENTWKLYILRCRDGSLYTGITTDVEKRFEAHNSGKGAKYTRGRGPLELVYREECGDRELYPFMLDGAKPLYEVAASRSEPYTMIFGNEATGLPAEFASIGQSTIIPQSKDIDSLNLGVAVSVGAYAFTNGGK